MPRRASVSLPTIPVEQLSLPDDNGAEQTPPQYSLQPAWIDTQGRTRTWSMIDPHGTKMAEITTKRAAEKLIDILNRSMSGEHER